MKFYRAIALTFGFEDERKLNWMVWECEKPFSSRKSALRSLCLYLFKMFKLEVMDNLINTHLILMPSCCSDHYDEEKKFPFTCKVCARQYDKPSFEFCEYDFVEFLLNLGDSTIGDINSQFLDNEDNKITNPLSWKFDSFNFEIPNHQMLVVYELAEIVILRCLYESIPELIKQNKINFMICEDVYNDILVDDTFSEEDVKETKILEYPNGAKETIVDGITKSIIYNSGDEVKFDYKNGNYEIVQTISGDKKTVWNKYSQTT